MKSGGDLEKAYISYYKAHFCMIHTIPSHPKFAQKHGTKKFQEVYDPLNQVSIDLLTIF